jgi:hypothetical protein
MADESISPCMEQLMRAGYSRDEAQQTCKEAGDKHERKRSSQMELGKHAVARRDSEKKNPRSGIMDYIKSFLHMK